MTGSFSSTELASKWHTLRVNCPVGIISDKELAINKLMDSQTTKVDCAVFVLDATTAADDSSSDLAKEVLSVHAQAKELVVLVNKCEREVFKFV